MNDYCVYIHIFPNGKVYIGQTRQKPETRWSKGKGYRGQFVGRAIHKYGWDNIIHKIVKSHLTKDQANELEIELIKKYDSTNKRSGYNIAFGGCANAKGLKHTDKHNRKISDSHKKKVCCFTREGKKVGTFESIMQAAEFVGCSYKTISSCCNGNKRSACGYIWRFEGKAFDQFETRNQKGGVKGFPVLAETINGELIGIYRTVKEASKTVGVRQDVIAEICRGKRDQKNGLVFSYCEISKLTEEENNGEEGNQEL